MKLQLHLAVFFILCCATTGFAQTKTPIVDELNSSKPGQGKVTVYIDDNVKEKLSSPATNSDKEIKDSVKTKLPPGTIIKCPGYKIQVFSGNDQRNSKNEAYYKQTQLRNMFPDIDTVVSFQSPFWKLRAGNYRTHAEAVQAMRDMKRALPSLGKEMYVVRDQVKIVVE